MFRQEEGFAWTRSDSRTGTPTPPAATPTSSPSATGGPEAGRIDTAFVAGRPGQDLLELAPDAVLHSVGRTAARLHRTDTAAFATPAELGPAAPGAVLVHGDFGPQNLLLDPVTFEVTAVVDWEFAHLGDGVLDLAWAEWIVRTHHPHLVAALPSLFDGYGAAPDRDRRTTLASTP